MNTRHLLLVLPFALLVACSQPADSPTPPAAQSSAKADEPLLAPEDAVPTEEEAADSAAKTIDDSNADAELEKLKQELENPK